MWEKEISIVTTATKEQVWEIWSEVNNWNKWDEEVIRSSLNGEFKKGTKGILIPTNGPKSNFIIHSATYPIEFTTRASLPFSKMDFTHKISEENGKTVITHGVKISGFTSFIFSRLIGEKIISVLPKALEKLSNAAKEIKYV